MKAPGGTALCFSLTPTWNGDELFRGLLAHLRAAQFPSYFSFGYRECEIVLSKTLQNCPIFWVGECLYFGRSKGLMNIVLWAIVLGGRLIIWLYLNQALTDYL